METILSNITNQMKLKCGHRKKKTDQFLPVVLFNMLNNVVLTLRFRLCMKSKSVTIQMKVY